MKKTVIILITIVLPLYTSAQSAEEILQKVMEHNSTLKAARSTAEAEKEAGRIGVGLDNPEVEVAYLWGSPREDNPGRKDISAKQQLDFATLSGSKRRVADAEAELVDGNVKKEERQVYLEAAQLLVELTYCNKKIAELLRYDEAQQQLLAMCLKTLEEGTGIITDLDHVRLAAVRSAANVAKVKADREQLLYSLRTLAHDNTIEFASTDYAPSITMMPENIEEWITRAQTILPEMQTANQQIAVSKERVKLAKNENMPAFSLGYTSELVKGSEYRGAALGLTLPLWGNKHRVKAARRAQQAAEDQLQDAQYQLAQEYRQKYANAQALQKIATCYKGTLTELDHRDALYRAVESGHMGLHDYLSEIQVYYDCLDCFLEAERDAMLARIPFLF